VIDYSRALAMFGSLYFSSEGRAQGVI